MEDPHLLVDARVSITIEENEALPVALPLRVVPSMTVEFEPGTLPVGSFLSAVDERSGMVFTRDVADQPARIRVPARAVILCSFLGEDRALGCLRVTGKPQEVLRLPGLSSPLRGHGQAFLGFAFGSEGGPEDVAVFLERGGVKHPPDAFTGLGSRLWALWLSQASGRSVLRIESRAWQLSGAVDIDVPERGTLVRMRIPLTKKPSLDVRFKGAEVLPPGAVDVDLMDCGNALAQFEGGTPPPVPRCRSVLTESGKAAEGFRFAAVESRLYALRWKQSALEGAVWIDMRAGASREVEVPIEVVEVTGTIKKKGVGLLAGLKWEAVNQGGTVFSRSDENGRFSLRLPHPGPWGVGIRGDDGSEWSEDVEVGRNRTFDFDLPSNKVTIKVTSPSGTPVSEARVMYEVVGPSGARIDFGTRTTNADGEVSLPVVPLGRLTTKAFAKGFRPADGAPLEVQEGTGRAIVRIQVIEGAGIRVHVVSPDGSPSAGAIVWSGDLGTTADGNGVAVFEQELPSRAPLVAFDVKGNMGFFRFEADEQSIRIPMSGPPIRVRFRGADGRPVYGQNVIVGADGVLDDRRLLNQALLSGGDAHSKRDGTMNVTGIPGEGLIMIAPWGHLELGRYVAAPVMEELTFTLPAPR